MDDERAPARVTAVGIGLIGYMVAWIVFARITERLIDQPAAAWAAMAAALVTGFGTSIAAMRRLGRT